MCATDEVEAINKTDVAASQGLELHDSKDDETTPLAGTLPASPLPDHQAAHSSPQIQGRSEMSTSARESLLRRARESVFKATA